VTPTQDPVDPGKSFEDFELPACTSQVVEERLGRADEALLPCSHCTMYGISNPFQSPILHLRYVKMEQSKWFSPLDTICDYGQPKPWYIRRKGKNINANSEPENP
jgi:hypothetical protein